MTNTQSKTGGSQLIENDEQPPERSSFHARTLQKEATKKFLTCQSRLYGGDLMKYLGISEPVAKFSTMEQSRDIFVVPASLPHAVDIRGKSTDEPKWVDLRDFAGAVPFHMGRRGSFKCDGKFKEEAEADMERIEGGGESLTRGSG